MTEISLGRNILIQYFIWYFYDQSLLILKAWKNFLLFNLNFFSVPVLLKSFFSPWKRYEVSYGRGFAVSRYFEAFFSNSIFRVLGMILRSVLIILGLLIEALILLFGLSVFIFWVVLPFLLIVGLFQGFKLLFF